MKKRISYLILGLGISSGTMLINKFIVPLPDWAAIILALLAAIFIILFIFKRDHSVE